MLCFSMKMTRTISESKVKTNCTLCAPKFTTSSDNKLVDLLLRYQNAPHHLLKLAIPTMLSLGLCPLTLFLYGPMMDFFWPGKMPNINGAIGSFLMTAGLVYAISFGFAFQEAQNKQNKVNQSFKTLD